MSPPTLKELASSTKSTLKAICERMDLNLTDAMAGQSGRSDVKKELDVVSVGAIVGIVPRANDRHRPGPIPRFLA